MPAAQQLLLGLERVAVLPLEGFHHRGVGVVRVGAVERSPQSPLVALAFDALGCTELFESGEVLFAASVTVAGPGSGSPQMAANASRTSSMVAFE